MGALNRTAPAVFNFCVVFRIVASRGCLKRAFDDALHDRLRPRHAGVNRMELAGGRPLLAVGDENESYVLDLVFAGKVGSEVFEGGEIR